MMSEERLFGLLWLLSPLVIIIFCYFYNDGPLSSNIFAIVFLIYSCCIAFPQSDKWVRQEFSENAKKGVDPKTRLG